MERPLISSASSSEIETFKEKHKELSEQGKGIEKDLRLSLLSEEEEEDYVTFGPSTISYGSISGKLELIYLAFGFFLQWCKLSWLYGLLDFCIGSNYSGSSTGALLLLSFIIEGISTMYFYVVLISKDHWKLE
jgi:hypothetical protein